LGNYFFEEKEIRKRIDNSLSPQYPICFIFFTMFSRFLPKSLLASNSGKIIKIYADMAIDQLPKLGMWAVPAGLFGKKTFPSGEIRI
jgi:hypothetical protein